MINSRNRQVADLQLFETGWVELGSLVSFQKQTYLDGCAVLSTSRESHGRFTIQVKRTLTGYKVAVPRVCIIERGDEMAACEYLPVSQILRGRHLQQEIAEMIVGEVGWTLPTAVNRAPDGSWGLRYDSPVYHSKKRPVLGLVDLRRKPEGFTVFVPQYLARQSQPTVVPFTYDFGYVPQENVSFRLV